MQFQFIYLAKYFSQHIIILYEGLYIGIIIIISMHAQVGLPFDTMLAGQMIECYIAK